MATGLSEIKANFRDYSRPNLYAVQIQVPQELRGAMKEAENKSLFKKFFGGGVSGFISAIVDSADPNVADMVNFAAKSLVIPSIAIHEIPTYRMGTRIAVPGDLELGDLSITFINDADFKIYNFFLQWISYITDPNTNIGRPAKSVIGGNASESFIKIQCVDGRHQMVYEVQLNRPFPKSLGEINLDSDSENAISQFQVNFGYTNISVSSATPAPPKSALANIAGGIGGTLGKFF